MWKATSVEASDNHHIQDTNHCRINKHHFTNFANRVGRENVRMVTSQSVSALKCGRRQTLLAKSPHFVNPLVDVFIVEAPLLAKSLLRMRAYAADVTFRLSLRNDFARSTLYGFFYGSFSRKACAIYVLARQATPFEMYY